ncbi:hypothetical protein K8R47_01680 [archaeon]|nr:hypothetical protein [archaeon]
MARGVFNLTKETVFWVVRIIIVSIFIIFIILMVSSYVDVQANVEETENQVLVNSLVNCLIENDYLEINSFDENQVKGCLNLNEDKIGLRLRLYYNNETELIVNEKVLRREPLCSFEKNFACLSKGFYVLVKDEEIYPAGLRIDVVNIR